MFHTKRLLCIIAAMLMLCGCSRQGVGTVIIVDNRPQTERPRTTMEAEMKIPVIDTLPEVDETIPRELTPLPSSEVLNIIGREEAQQCIRQEDGTLLDEQFTVYNVICHDHNVSFCAAKEWTDHIVRFRRRCAVYRGEGT